MSEYACVIKETTFCVPISKLRNVLKFDQKINFQIDVHEHVNVYPKLE